MLRCRPGLDIRFVPLAWGLGAHFQLPMVLNNTSVARCSSGAEGGFISAYDNAVVLISLSVFESMYTMGYGSVLKAAESIVLILQPDFINCSSSKVGA